MGENPDLRHKSDEKLSDEIKFLQIRITELEKAGHRHKQADELLRKIELQQKAILNNIPDIAWLKDKESRFICVNEAFARACGFKVSELIGKTDLDVWPKELADRYRADDLEVIKLKIHKVIEEPLADKQGKIKWIETIKTPILNDAGEVIGTTGIARDITDRKSYEERLRETRAELEIRVKVRTAELARINEDLIKSETRYREIFHTVPVAIWEEDFSQVKVFLDNLKAQGVSNLRRYFEEHPDKVQEAVNLVKINDVNEVCLRIYEAKNKEELFGSLTKIFSPDSYSTFVNELIGIWNQEPYFESECINLTCSGRKKTFILRMQLPQSKEDYRKVLVSLTDISIRKETENKLKDSESRFRGLFDNISSGVAVFKVEDNGNKFVFLDYNQAAEKIDNIKKEEVIGRDVVEVFSGIESFGLLEVFKRVWLTNKSEFYPAAIYKDNKLNSWRENYVYKLPSGEIVAVYNDISDRKKSEEDIKKSETQFRVLFESTPVGIIIADSTTRKFKYANKAIGEMLGYAREEMLDLDVAKLHPQEVREEIIKVFDNIPFEMPQVIENIPCIKKDGSIIFVNINSSNAIIDGVNCNLGFFTDVTERLEAEKRLEVLNKELLKTNKTLKQISLTDPHTGLYNHRYLGEVIEAEYHRAKRYAHPLSVIMIDLDYFKSINDVYGHGFGDLVLKQFAHQLKMMVRRYDTVIRLGGEEFLVISPGIDKTQALIVSQRILNAINLYNFGDKKHSVRLKISLAVVASPEDKGSKGMDLVNLSDLILSKVKESGGNRVYSSEDIFLKRKGLKKGKIKPASIKVLKSKIDKLTKDANQGLTESIFAFAKTIEVKDHYTGEHVENTVRYATLIAQELGLSKDEIELIKQASMLHDLGKIGISEKILQKKAKLSKAEFEDIKRHPQIGADILRPIKFLHNIIPLIFYHHERWDGKGYPSGIEREEIPIGARIIAVSDVYQALTSDRPYRKAYSKKKAMKILEEGSGTQFDPQIIAAFLKILKKEK